MRGEACEVQRSAKRAKRAKRCNGVVQRLEQWSPKPKIWVQFPSPLKIRLRSVFRLLRL